ncbi:MAG: DNA-binding MarR family transcriptional regulator [Candidatus Paceibacteria bacterium]|jgi:DNA-binding MarR family transcriptional regulator
MFVIVHHLKKDFVQFVSQYDLTEMEAKFIFYIGDENNKTSALIERFKKHKSTIRQKTLALEKKGFIVVKASTEDKRERIIDLTKKGKDFYIEMKKIEKKYHNTVFKDFSEEDREGLMRLLQKLEITENYDCNIC